MIYLLLGPSGSGKTTLSQCLKETGIPELISHSTRPMRKGESEGSPYYFVTREQFEQVEMIEGTEYNGNLYGTSVSEVERVLSSSTCAFTIVDKHGAEQFKSLYGSEQVKIIYVYVPVKLAVERMRARGDSEDDIADRIRHAFRSGEFDNLEIADCCIVNKDLDASLRQLKAIVEGGVTVRMLNERFQRLFDWQKKDAIRHGFTEEELSIIYLNNPAFKVTKSNRIWRLITLAYYLGQLNGIRYCDEMLNAKITLRGED
jgi:guanylate kinase